MSLRNILRASTALVALIVLAGALAGCAPNAQPAGPSAAPTATATPAPAPETASPASTSPAEASGVVIAIPGQQTWICTMCPDVRSDKPGKCPNCGMDLVLKK
jgi:hypothetical protein